MIEQRERDIALFTFAFHSRTPSGILYFFLLFPRSSSQARSVSVPRTAISMSHYLDVKPSRRHWHFSLSPSLSLPMPKGRAGERLLLFINVTVDKQLLKLMRSCVVLKLASPGETLCCPSLVGRRHYTVTGERASDVTNKATQDSFSSSAVDKCLQ